MGCRWSKNNKILLEKLFRGSITNLNNLVIIYNEQTDGVIWVIDSADKRRLGDCAEELRTILQQEKLAGASLLIFANKQDLPGALPADEIAKV